MAMSPKLPFPLKGAPMKPKGPAVPKAKAPMKKAPAKKGSRGC